MPAAAESTTNEAEQFAQAKMMSPLDFGPKVSSRLLVASNDYVKQETYRAPARMFREIAAPMRDVD